MQLLSSSLITTKHAFSTRDGGVSKPPYNSLNLAYHVGDNKADVTTNHTILAKALGYDAKKVVFMNQIHSNKVTIITTIPQTMPSCDALITNKKGIALMVMGADCAPVLFEDKITQTIAVAHVGRAGALTNIITNVINTMKENFDSKPHDICVCIGPSIKQCCYEIGEKQIQETQQKGYSFALQGRMLDIDAIIKTQLLQNNIEENHIEFLEHCTCCENERFFSYRANKTTGRIAGVIILEE